MASGQYRLQFLHISDLHAKGPQEEEAWRRRRVLGDAWLRNLETLVNEEGHIDFVFFTGDAAQSGKPEEYAEVTDFLGSLLEELDLKPDRLFVVPGNHDVDRRAQQDVWKSMRWRLAATNDLLGVSRWMNGISPPPLGFEDSWKTAILDRELGYRAWVKGQLHRADLVPDGLGYRAQVLLPGYLPIHIVGLDTAWLCGDDADAGRLLLTENQLGRHLNDDRGDPLPGLRIVLMHHPLHELADGPSIKRLLADRADLVLRGHLHQTEVVEWIDPDRRLRELASGSLYEGGLADTYGNSCQFVRLELDSNLRPIEAMVRFRTFSPRAGHWFDDNSLYREGQAGRITWTFGAPATHRKPEPVQPLDATARPLLRSRWPLPTPGNRLRRTPQHVAGGRLAHREDHHPGRLGEAAARARRGGEAGFGPGPGGRLRRSVRRDRDRPGFASGRGRCGRPANRLDRCGLRLGASTGGAGG
jgi:predicted phosphodiesterase